MPVTDTSSPLDDMSNGTKHGSTADSIDTSSARVRVYVLGVLFLVSLLLCVSSWTAVACLSKRAPPVPAGNTTAAKMSQSVPTELPPLPEEDLPSLECENPARPCGEPPAMQLTVSNQAGSGSAQKRVISLEETATSLGTQSPRSSNASPEDPAATAATRARRGNRGASSSSAASVASSPVLAEREPEEWFELQLMVDAVPMAEDPSELLQKLPQSPRSVDSLPAGERDALTCLNCGAEIEFVEPARCPRCAQALYCSADCMEEDWPYHQRACLQGMPPSSGAQTDALEVKESPILLPQKILPDGTIGDSIGSTCGEECAGKVGILNTGLRLCSQELTCSPERRVDACVRAGGHLDNMVSELMEPWYQPADYDPWSYVGRRDPRRRPPQRELPPMELNE
eukprot:gnl/TRDRNA2_/TRDRNA2_151766_c2_seq1.p1 gnl/TRDRNA2_/TRDRNA2_151766_c2~~gnl/TRDRNA2_/TRDRNA2_151766_c2_seq1.p1  ORF type:complete len:419 (-),score=61.06 gnl/TRDRNA2_/TRDRNA2_151766_c2_seq1:43-1239(-)